MTVTEALNFRRAVPVFNTEVQISVAELEGLIDTANLSPSSMNLQPWEFIVAHSPEDKARLQAVTMNQPKVSQASASIVVVGNLKHHENAAEVGRGAVERGYYNEEKMQATIDMAHGWFGSNPDVARTEVLRGCSLWAMSFMLAAAEAGWDTAPMSGFDPAGISKEFGLPEHMMPVVVIAVGKRTDAFEMAPRNVRFPAKRLMHVGNW